VKPAEEREKILQSTGEKGFEGRLTSWQFAGREKKKNMAREGRIPGQRLRKKRRRGQQRTLEGGIEIKKLRNQKTKEAKPTGRK